AVDHGGNGLRPRAGAARGPSPLQPRGPDDGCGRPAPVDRPHLQPVPAGVMRTEALLTGFRPFAGALTNESWEAVRAAAPALRSRGIRVEARELPVEFGTASAVLAEAVEELRPRL